MKSPDVLNISHHLDFITVTDYHMATSRELSGFFEETVLLVSTDQFGSHVLYLLVV